MSVLVGPGWMMLTVMPRAPKSRARPRALRRRLGRGMGRAALERHAIAIDRTDDDDAAAIIHLPRRLDRRMIGRADIDIDHPVDRIGVQRQRIAQHQRAGIDDQHVERALARHHVDHRLAIGRVGSDGTGADIGSKRGGSILRPGIGEGDIGAVIGEAPHDRGTDTPAAAEDEDFFGSEIGHGTIPC